MNGLISFLGLMVFLFAGLAQHGEVSKQAGYGIAIPLAVGTMILALFRYRQRKGRGE
jgi:hypothetical protein